MSRRAVAVVVLLGQVAACRSEEIAPPTWRDLLGCWEVSVGRFEGTSIDSGMTTMPEVVRLDSVPGINWLRDPIDRRVEAVPLDAVTEHKAGSYKLVGGDSLILSWSTGFTGLDIRVSTRSTPMRGEAQLWTDYSGFQRAPVELGRVGCSGRAAGVGD